MASKIDEILDNKRGHVKNGSAFMILFLIKWFLYFILFFSLQRIFVKK